jgi:hypothetical protein
MYYTCKTENWNYPTHKKAPHIDHVRLRGMMVVLRDGLESDKNETAWLGKADVNFAFFE